MSSSASGGSRPELLQVADAVAREKSIDKSVIIEALEEAMRKIARMRYGQDLELDVRVDPDTGDFDVSHLLQVADDDEDLDANHIALSFARRENPDLAIGDILRQPLPRLEFGRTGAQTAKQIIAQKVREAERENQYQEYKDRVGEIVYGIVKRVEYGNVIVDLGKGEGVVRRECVLPRETFRNGDRIRAYIREVDRESRGPQILLSRTDSEFMVKLFAQEVPEIYEGTGLVVAVVRDPGSRAKIAVASRDASIDPVGACVGMRGNRVQAVVNELHGEKIDIIPWAENAENFIVNALAPAEIVKVVVDDDANAVDVVVSEDQLSLAIGRRGQNVRLASQLTGWRIEIMTEDDESKRRQEEFSRRSALFAEALDLDEIIAQLLAAEGFESIEDLAEAAVAEIAVIEGFDDETAEEIHRRADEWIAAEREQADNERRRLGVEDALCDIPGLSLPMSVALGKAGIVSVDDLAGCSVDDLIGWREVDPQGEETVEKGFLSECDLAADAAEAIVMHARRRLGWLPDEPDDAQSDDAQPDDAQPDDAQETGGDEKNSDDAEAMGDASSPAAATDSPPSP